jgi:glycosyltransferase involved in cell wall biosynthesis
MAFSTSKPRVLMLIPSEAKRDIAEAVHADAHPIMDYFALRQALDADLLDYSSLNSGPQHALVRVMRKVGRDAALAALGYLRRSEYDVIFSNGENVSIPLSILLKRHRRRPGHVLIGHRISPVKKRPFFRILHPQMDAILLYSSVQRQIALKELGIPESKLHLIPFHADHRFYRPMPASRDGPPRMICSAGLEWRDYPTLIEAVRGMHVQVRLGAASPWSKHRNETVDRQLPPNVSARRYEYSELRQLYADARFIVVPLYENDFQAGITTILEGMAMGRAVITTKTTGQIDAIEAGVNGLYVLPGDVSGWRAAIQGLLDSPDESARLGANARRAVEDGMSLEKWVDRLAHVIRGVAEERSERMRR